MPNVRKQKEYVDEWKRLWEPDLEAIGTNSGQTCDPTRVDPKVLRWVKDHCIRMPHFVKIINPHAAHGRPGLLSRNANCLGVPMLFVKQHFRELGRVITLEQDDGRKWKVAFGSPRNYPILSQGWDRFARDKNLKCGDVAVFVLVRNSCFHFKLFDADGNVSEKSTSTLNNDSTVLCKKEFPSSSSQSLQDQPFLRNPETEQHPKTKKRLFTVSTDHLSTEQLPEYKKRVDAAIDTLPRHGHLEPNRLPVPAKEQTGFLSSSSQSHQDQPFVSNPETEQHLKTTTDRPSPEQSPKYKKRDGAVTDTLPRRGDLEPNLLPVPAKEQTASPAYNEKKLKKFGEEFRAPSQTLNLATEDEIVTSRVENSNSKTIIAIPPSTKDAPKRATDSSKLSPALTPLPAPSPRFESLNPLAFTFKSRRRTITPLERQRAREMAMAHAGHIPGHYFMSVMSETHVYRDFHLVLPNGFVAALRLPASPTRLKLLDGAGHSWDMYSKKNALNQFALHRKYWALFALHHLLEEGDVCVFAIKESNENSTVNRTVVVRIFRVVPIATADISSSVHAHYETHTA